MLTGDADPKLLDELSERNFDRASPELRENILTFYSDLSAPDETKKGILRWQNVLTLLDQLKPMTSASALANSHARAAATGPTLAPVAPTETPPDS